MNRVLWALQILLGLLFLMAGGVKLILPLDQLAKQAPQLPALFLRFVGVLEVAGALGLVLPQLLRIRPKLTPLAAVCLLGIMIGATVVTVMGASPEQAIAPVTIGLLLTLVAYGRWSLTNTRPRFQSSARAAALPNASSHDA
jgi:uncharacterized membrane protein YphA (DoxX/SURF4 family)